MVSLLTMCDSLLQLSSPITVPPVPSGVGLIPLNSTAIQVVWEQFASGTVPGILVNFTISYNRRHHGGHPTVVSVGPNE